MALIFPPIIPNYFTDVTLPDYNIIVYNNDDGTQRRRILHTTGNHTRATLKYEGRNETEVATIVSFYQQAKAMTEVFTIDDTIIRHPAAYRAGLLALGSTTLWRFESPIQITTVFVGIYNFDVKVISVIV